MDTYAQAIQRRDQHQSVEAVSRFAGVLGNMWLFTCVFLLVTALGIMHALTRTPLYEAGTVIQIKREGKLTGESNAEANVSTEMEILKSRSILLRVVERLQLDILLDQEAPTVGSIVHDLLDRDQPAGSVPSPRRQVEIARLELPGALLSMPMTMAIRTRDTFHLASDKLGVAGDGIVGSELTLASRYGPIDVLVRKIAAAPGTRFVLRRVSTNQAAEQLQRALVVTENVKQSNVIKLTLQGADRQLMSQILGEIVAEYRRQRRAEQQAEAAELAATFDRQLSASKAAVRKVDEEYASLLQRSGIAEPETESRLLLQQSSALEMQLATAQQRKTELSARLGDGHPEMQALDRQIADTGRALRRNASRYESLAGAARELARISGEKRALDEAAQALASQRGKLDAMISSERDDVRVLETPQTSLRPVTLGRSTMLILSCCGGIAAGLLVSFMKSFLAQRRRILLSTRHHTRFRLISQGRIG